MWNIMVADDEPKIRRGLCKFVEKTGLPLTVCAQAGDGAQALKLLQEHCPDIVLLDICMPHMDGLEFLSEARRQSIKSKFIVITGFDEFSFAQQSVSLKAFAYLLKPINERELLENLNAAIAELESERANEQKNRQALVQLEHNQNLLRSAFEEKWMNGGLDIDSWREQSAFWGITWPQEAYLSLVKPDFKRGGVPYKNEQSLMLFGVANMVSELMEHLKVCFCGRDDKGYCAIITEKNPSQDELSEYMSIIHSFLKLHCIIDCLKLASPQDLAGGINEIRQRFEEIERANPMLEEIKQYIAQNYQDPNLCLIDVANALNISQSYISRLMKTALQTTFVDYLTAKRIDEAIQLMSDPGNKLAWVSTQVGFSNQHYFSSVFKKQTGMSPSAYREKNFL